MTTNDLAAIPEKVRKLVDTQVKTVNAQLRNVSHRVEVGSREVEKRLKKKDWLKAAQRLQKELERRVNEVRTEAFHMAGVATTHDIENLQRKVRELSKKAPQA